MRQSLDQINLESLGDNCRPTIQPSFCGGWLDEHQEPNEYDDLYEQDNFNLLADDLYQEKDLFSSTNFADGFPINTIQNDSLCGTNDFDLISYVNELDLNDLNFADLGNLTFLDDECNHENNLLNVTANDQANENVYVNKPTIQTGITPPQVTYDCLDFGSQLQQNYEDTLPSDNYVYDIAPIQNETTNTTIYYIEESPVSDNLLLESTLSPVQEFKSSLSEEQDDCNASIRSYGSVKSVASSLKRKSVDEDEDDEEWSPSTVDTVTTGKTRNKKKRPVYSTKKADARAKHQNKVAAQRYRKKKNDLKLQMESDLQIKNAKNIQLKAEIDELQIQIKVLKELLAKYM